MFYYLQPIEPDAIALLENGNCTITTAVDPNPKPFCRLFKDAHGLILRTVISITRDLLAGLRRAGAGI